MSDVNDHKVAKAQAAAKRARIMSFVWWIQVPIVCIVYWFISKEPPIEKMILIYLAGVSIIANAVSYATKSEAAKSEAAGLDS